MSRTVKFFGFFIITLTWVSLLSCTNKKVDKNVVVVNGYLSDGKDKMELVINKYEKNDSINETFTEGNSYSMNAVDKNGKVTQIKQFDLKEVKMIPECPKEVQCKAITNREFKIVFDAPAGLVSIQITKGKDIIAEKKVE